MTKDLRKIGIRALRDFLVEELKPQYGELEAKSLAEGMFYYMAGVSKTEFVLDKEKTLPEGLLSQLVSGLEDLKNEKPLQYVTGRAEFMGLTLKVDENVLIPRPETEELVQWAIDENQGRQKLRILDAGTGSGCIALACKHYLPDTTVFGIDRSPKAIEIAKKNAMDLALDISLSVIDLLQDDILVREEPFDIIISNPPYVTESERPFLKQNVKGYEPGSALFVPDADPLIYYRALANFALKGLKRDGIMYLEINEKFGAECRGLYLRSGFDEVVVRQDLSGRDRMVRAAGIKR